MSNKIKFKHMDMLDAIKKCLSNFKIHIIIIIIFLFYNIYNGSSNS